MAGDWIKIREDLHEDAAVLIMSERMRTRPEVVVGYLVRFWSWVSRQTDDGTIRGVSLEMVESVLNMPNFLGYLCDVGWLEYIEDTHGKAIIIPHFERHLSESAKKRAKDQRRKQEQRAAQTASTPRPQSVRKKVDKTRTREEERREEKKREEKEKTSPQAAGCVFDDFWSVYPRRNGIRKEKRKAAAAFRKLSPDDQQAAIQAAIAYANSGELPKDAFRWLAGDWREWLLGGVYEAPKTDDAKRAENYAEQWAKKREQRQAAVQGDLAASLASRMTRGVQ